MGAEIGERHKVTSKMWSNYERDGVKRRMVIMRHGMKRRMVMRRKSDGYEQDGGVTHPTLGFPTQKWRKLMLTTWIYSCLFDVIYSSFSGGIRWLISQFSKFWNAARSHYVPHPHLSCITSFVLCMLMLWERMIVGQPYMLFPLSSLPPSYLPPFCTLSLSLSLSLSLYLSLSLSLNSPAHVVQYQ